MPVPASINDLSTTAASNSPGGGENPFPDLDNHIRALASFIAVLRDGKLDASTVSAFMLTVLNDADAATARTTLGAVGLTGNETVAGTKTFSSSPIAPTPTTGDNTTKVATTAFVKTTAEASAAAAVSDRVRVYQPAAKSTASGTAVDFSPADGTGIPSWAREVTISFSGVSLSGSDLFVVLLGTSAGLVTSGYEGSYQLQTIASPSNGVGGNFGVNFALSANTAAGDVRHGSVTLTHMGSNRWVISGTSGLGGGGGSNTTFLAGSVQLPGVLDRLQFAPNGSNTLDGGSVSYIAKG